MHRILNGMFAEMIFAQWKITGNAYAGIFKIHRKTLVLTSVNLWFRLSKSIQTTSLPKDMATNMLCPVVWYCSRYSIPV